MRNLTLGIVILALTGCSGCGGNNPVPKTIEYLPPSLIGSFRADYTQSDPPDSGTITFTVDSHGNMSGNINDTIWGADGFQGMLSYTGAYTIGFMGHFTVSSLSGTFNGTQIVLGAKAQGNVTRTS